MKTIRAKTFWTCIALGVVLRLVFMSLGYNFDFESWQIVGELAASGKNIYANTGRYNYGPAWFILLGMFWRAASYFANNILAFRIFVVGTLTLADFLIAQVISRKAGNFWGIIFFLNPVSLLMTSCYNQFDNVAVMIGAWGALYLEESSQQDSISRNDLYGIILLSLSLITKHILYAFPVWILLNKNITARKKILYAFIPPLLFLLSFAPYWNIGYEGIVNHVFRYRSFNNFPLFAIGILQRLGLSMPFNKHYIYLFIVLMVCAGHIFRNENIFDSFLLYTMSLVCFSSALIPNYFVIPCMAVLLLFRKRSAVYFACITVLMICGHNSVNFLIRLYEHLGGGSNAFINFLYAERHTLETRMLTTMQTFLITIISYILLVYLVAYYWRKRKVIE